jgi:Zn-dependent protease
MKVALPGGKLTLDFQPAFWLTVAAVAVPAGHGDTTSAAVWCGAVALAIVLHELGHAGMALAFGSGADIVLYAFGGETRPRAAASFKRWQSFSVTAAGCAAGLLIAGACYAAMITRLVWLLPPAGVQTVYALYRVSLLLSLMNLLPIQPMDGGRLLRMVLQARHGLKGLRVSHAVGLATAVVVAAWFALQGKYFTVAFAAYFALGEYRAMRRALEFSEMDMDESVHAEFTAAQAAWKRGEKTEATAALVALRAKTKSGVVFDAATAQLSNYLDLQGDAAQAYALLKTMPQDRLSPASVRALQHLAFAAGDFAASVRVGQNEFQREPKASTAGLLAAGYAATGDAVRTVQWLSTALRLGMPDAALDSKEYDRVRGEPVFREFMLSRAPKDGTGQV